MVVLGVRGRIGGNDLNSKSCLNTDPDATCGTCRTNSEIDASGSNRIHSTPYLLFSCPTIKISTNSTGSYCVEAMVFAQARLPRKSAAHRNLPGRGGAVSSAPGRRSRRYPIANESQVADLRRLRADTDCDCAPVLCTKSRTLYCSGDTPRFLTGQQW